MWLQATPAREVIAPEAPAPQPCLIPKGKNGIKHAPRGQAHRRSSLPRFVIGQVPKGTRNLPTTRGQAGGARAGFGQGSASEH
jgi:hypothetical protein